MRTPGSQGPPDTTHRTDGYPKGKPDGYSTGMGDWKQYSFCTAYTRTRESCIGSRIAPGIADWHKELDFFHKRCAAAWVDGTNKH